MEVMGELHVPAALPPGKDAGSRMAGSWAPEPIWTFWEYISHLPGLEPWTVQTTNRCTDYSILVPHIMVIKTLIIKLKGGEEKENSAYFLDCNSNTMNYDIVILEVGPTLGRKGLLCSTENKFKRSHQGNFWADF
jgi:hypothetical protein